MNTQQFRKKCMQIFFNDTNEAKNWKSHCAHKSNYFIRICIICMIILFQITDFRFLFRVQIFFSSCLNQMNRTKIKQNKIKHYWILLQVLSVIRFWLQEWRQWIENPLTHTIAGAKHNNKYDNLWGFKCQQIVHQPNFCARVFIRKSMSAFKSH